MTTTTTKALHKRIGFEPENEKTDAVKQCIETIIRGGEWPRSPNPLVIAEREWTFEMK